jgi:hypothetical protein
LGDASGSTSGATSGSGSGKGGVISGIAHATTGVDKGPTICQVASNGNCRAEQQGQGAQHGKAGQHRSGNGCTPAPTTGVGGTASTGNQGSGSGSGASCKADPPKHGHDKGSGGSNSQRP